MESIITSAKRNVKFEGVDENSTRKLLIAETRDLDIRIIIATEKGNVKFEEADESSTGSFSQNSAGALGVEIIITSAKKIVKSEEVDEKPEGGLLAELYRGPRRRVSSLRQKEL